MIAKIEGLLEAVEDSHARVKMPGGFTMEVLLSAYTAARLGASIDTHVTLHTILYLESQAQGATIIPRLAGFLDAEDRAFFRLFVTCKGIGHRKALRAMSMSTTQIAAAIADRDLATLQSLPEVGRRTAETIATTLHDKVERFVGLATSGAGGGGAGVTPSVGGSIGRSALEVLLQLGENRTQAVAWIDQILSQENAPTDVQGLIAEVYRLKASV